MQGLFSALHCLLCPLCSPLPQFPHLPAVPAPPAQLSWGFGHVFSLSRSHSSSWPLQKVLFPSCHAVTRRGGAQLGFPRSLGGPPAFLTLTSESLCPKKDLGVIHP